MTNVQTRPKPIGDARPTRRGRAFLALVLITVSALILGGLILASERLAGLIAREACIATVDGVSVRLSPEQAANAATIAAVATRRGLPARAITIALATAYQESDLRNLGGGDLDSAGLFQQRPSQGWGAVDQVTDPEYAAGKFYDALVKIADYRILEITEAAQAVQRSAFPDAYADHEADARVLASALSGSSAASLSCSVRAPGAAAQVEGPSGLTPRAVAVRKAMAGAFGRLAVGGFAPGGVSTGHIEGSAHYDGRAIDVYFRPYDDPENTTNGWALAQWLVVNAKRLAIATVIYDDHIWSIGQSGAGWRTYVPSEQSEDAGTAAIQRHLDHVHVDVLRGT